MKNYELENFYRDSEQYVLSIVKNWYDVVHEKQNNGDFSKDISPDDAFKFMTFWISFNTLYQHNYKSDFFKNYNESKPKLEEKDYNSLIEKHKNTYRTDNCFLLKQIKFIEKDKDKKIISRYQYSKDKNENVKVRFTLTEKQQIFFYIDKLITEKKIGKDITLYLKNINEIKKDYKGLTTYEQKRGTKIESNYIKQIENDNCSSKEKLQCLMQVIYTIRCNLFHGEKCPLNERDLKLVSEGAKILEVLLKEIIGVHMKKSIYEEIKSDIESEKYLRFESESKWGGAGLIITNEHGKKIEEAKIKNEGVVFVESANAKYIVWLINRMKPYANIDYLSKYEFYPIIGKAANEYEDKNNIKGMLLHILEKVKEYLL